MRADTRHSIHTVVAARTRLHFGMCLTSIQTNQYFSLRQSFILCKSLKWYKWNGQEKNAFDSNVKHSHLCVRWESRHIRYRDYVQFSKIRTHTIEYIRYSNSIDGVDPCDLKVILKRIYVWWFKGRIGKNVGKKVDIESSGEFPRLWFLIRTREKRNTGERWKGDARRSPARHHFYSYPIRPSSIHSTFALI